MAVVRKLFNFMLLGAALLGVLAGVAQAAPAFPVKYSANRRYLVDQNGAPFPILAARRGSSRRCLSPITDLH